MEGSIRLMDNCVDPWIFIGDFNAVLGAHEQRGGSLPQKLSCEDYISWTESNSAVHIDTKGAPFTWSNGRIMAFTERRLDRTIVNQHCLSFFSSLSCLTLTRNQCDYSPILLSLEKGLKMKHSPFKFFNMWSEHPDCERLVKETWLKPVIGFLMYILVLKLKLLKVELKVWNKQSLVM